MNVFVALAPARLRRAAASALLVFAVAACAAVAHAHQLQVEPLAVVLRPQQTFVSAEFSGNVQDITQSINVEDGEKRGDGFAPAAEKRAQAYVNQHFLLKQDGRTLAGTLVSLRQQGDLDPTHARFHLTMRYPRPGGANAARPFTVTSTLADYLPNALTTVSVTGLQRNLKTGEATTIDPSAFAVNLLTNVRDFFALGVEHIFSGPDHILFILALLLVSPTLKSLIKTLTGFTIAHSITLILSTLGVFTVDARIVDVVVALSIVYVGLENIFLKSTRHRFWVASGFGLVHGLAFAGNLRDAGLPEGSALFWSLLSFNGGVEAAQVMICAAAFPLLMLWKRNTEARQKYGGLPWPSVVRVASTGVVIAGAYWLLQRVVG